MRKQRFRESFRGKRRCGHHVGTQPILSQRIGGLRTNCRQFHAAKNTQILPRGLDSLEESMHAVRAREHDPIELGCARAHLAQQPCVPNRVFLAFNDVRAGNDQQPMTVTDALTAQLDHRVDTSVPGHRSSGSGRPIPRLGERVSAPLLLLRRVAVRDFHQLDFGAGQLAEARQSVQALRNGVCGRLTVGSIPTITPYLLAPRVSEFRRLYPDGDSFVIAHDVDRSYVRSYDGFKARFISLENLISRLAAARL